MFIATAKEQEASVAPTADDVVLFLQDLMEFVPYGESLGELFSRESQRVRRVTSYGIMHGYFNYDGTNRYVDCNLEKQPAANRNREKQPARSFIFHDGGSITVGAPGEKLHKRLLLLDDASWLFSRKRIGNSVWRSAATRPATVHCHTAELLPVLKELGIVGQRAVQQLGALLVWLNPSLEVADSWSDLRSQAEAIYPIAA